MAVVKTTTSSPRPTGRLSVLPTDLLASPTPVAEELRAVIASHYDVDGMRLTVGAVTFDILHVRDTNRLLDLVSPEVFSEDERLPYWADLWTSSIDLAGWLLGLEGMAGKSVLELGSGVGLAGIAAARAGARVMLTDYETDALLFSRYNALTNLPADTFHRRVRCLPMDWRAPDVNEQFDLIVGADIVYERRNFLPILSLLQTHLVPGGSALLTEPDRSVGQVFLTAAHGCSFRVDHAFSSVTRGGKMYRISRMILRTQ